MTWYLFTLYDWSDDIKPMSSAGNNRRATSERLRVITREIMYKLKLVSPRHAAMRRTSRVSSGTTSNQNPERKYVYQVLRGEIQRYLQEHS